MDSFFVGSPPRMRGKGDAVRDNLDAGGITPAHAGKRGTYTSRATARWDHPRACGEKRCVICFTVAVAGSPPRMRGKAIRQIVEVEVTGITPAHAGKSQLAFQEYVAHWDHPRTCGEKMAITMPKIEITGSPPHMRGKAKPRNQFTLSFGITPAHAGKSIVKWEWTEVWWGSPPHMRGKGTI